MFLGQRHQENPHICEKPQRFMTHNSSIAHSTRQEVLKIFLYVLMNIIKLASYNYPLKFLWIFHNFLFNSNISKTL